MKAMVNFLVSAFTMAQHFARCALFFGSATGPKRYQLPYFDPPEVLCKLFEPPADAGLRRDRCGFFFRA